MGARHLGGLSTVRRRDHHRIGLGVLLGLAELTDAFGPLVLCWRPGLVMLAAALSAALITTVVKWVVVGPIRPGEHPLWSSFVWRTEVADTFTEMVAGPWFANLAAGSPALT